MDLLITDEQREKYIGFDDRWFIPIGIVTLALILPFFMKPNSMDSASSYLERALIGVFYVSCHWILARPLFVWLRQKLNEDRLSMRRFTYILIGLIGLILTVNFIGALGEYFLQQRGFQIHHNDPTLVQGLLISAIMCIMLTAIYESVFWFKKYRYSVLEQEQLKRINVQAQLDTLKNQVNPHFLFNSLNTLVSIIPENPDLAIEFVHKISQTYRNILEFRNEKTIAVQKELEALSSYIYLLKMRFQDKIIINNQLKDSILQRHIVPLSLQVLIENAVKHNIVSKKRPLSIEILEMEGSIVVKNNLQPKLQQQHSTKVGLANIKDRYELISDKRVQIIQNDEYFSVHIPLLDIKEH